VPASLLMVLASFLFATMGVCVKLASEFYSAGEIVMYRGLVGTVMMALLAAHQGLSLRTRVPGMHVRRSLAGVLALLLWFYAIGKLPLATAMTLNYMSSIWMALFLVAGNLLLGRTRVDPRLIGAVGVGFAGVALVLHPTFAQQQLAYGLCGLLSGVLAATAYLQVSALGRAGEPEYRIVFYFSVGGAVAGTLGTWLGSWRNAASTENVLHAHTLKGAMLLLAVGMLATVAQWLMTRAYGRGKTLVNASLQYLGIAFSTLYGVLLFHDRMAWSAMLGIALIVLAGLGATLLRSAGITAKPAVPSPTLSLVNE